MNAINKAIEHVGGQTELARQLGTSAQAVHNWRTRGSVPPEYAPLIEVLTNRAVTADELCPKIPWGMVRTDAA